MGETFRIDIPINVTDNTEPGISNASRKMSSFEKTMKNTEERLGKMKNSKVEMTLSAVDKASSVISKVKNGASNLMGKVWKTTVSVIDKATAPIRGILGMLANPLLQAGAVLGISIGVSDSINTFKDFEAAMSQVQAVSGATSAELEQLTQKAKEMGATTKFTATESAEAFNYMAMAGWKTSDMLSGIEGILNLAAASGADLATTSDIVTDALTAFGLVAGDAGHFSDVLAAASSNANTNVTMMGETFKYAGTMAGSLGYSIEDVALATGLMANAGVKSSMAGTALNSFMTRLATDAGASSKSLGALGVMTEELGVEFYNAEGNARPLGTVLRELRAATADLNDEEKSYYANKIAGMEAQKGLLAILNASEEDFKKLSVAVEFASTDINELTDSVEKSGVAWDKYKDKSWFSDGSLDGLIGDIVYQLQDAEISAKDLQDYLHFEYDLDEDDAVKAINAVDKALQSAEGSAKRMSDTMLDNLQGSLTLLQSAVDGAKIRLGERIAPYVREVADWLTGMMPGVNDAIDEMMDFVDVKIEALRKKIGTMTDSADWENADFFGKVKIAWDTIIAEPFSDWWESSGKAMMAEKAASIGQGIGSAISTGIMALFGLDVAGALDDGASIGAAFGKGFVDGLDVSGIKEKLLDVIKSLFSNAADILPGGDEAGLSSILSAALIAKVGGGILKTGMRGINLGRTIAGSDALPTMGSLITKGIGSYSVAGEMAGTGLAGGSGLLGLLGNTGAALGAGATTSTGMVLAGGGAIAGGVAAGASLISGFKDLKVALSENTDAAKSKAYGASGADKVLGVGAGAAAGAAIGSVVPVIGTAAGALIGAGIGGIAGWVMGKKEVEKYEESVKAAQEAEQAFALSQEQAKYSSQELKDALADTNMTTDEFVALFQRVAAEDLAAHFGDISLSLAEIKDLARGIAIDDETYEKMSKFSEAADNAQASFENLSQAARNMEKLEWKAGLGLKLDESDISSYTSGIENLIQSAKDYVEDKQYEVTVAMNLLMDDKSSGRILSDVNAMYADLQSQIETIGNNLTAKVKVALQDGVIEIDEAAEIENLQKQLTDITDKVSQAQTEAKMEALKIKYDGAALDASSFQQLQAELKTQMEEITSTYDETLEIGITNLKLTYPNGGDQYESALKELTDSYEAKIEELNVNVESFQLDAIASAYDDSFDNILPALEGTTSEKLHQALSNAMAAGIEPTEWDSDTVSRFLGLEGLGEEAKANIAELMGSVAATIPESIAEKMAEEGDFTMIADATTDAIGTALEEADYSVPVEAVVTGIAGEMSSEASMALMESAAQSLGASTNEYLTNEFTLNVGNEAGNEVPGNVSMSLDRSKENVHPGCDAVTAEVDSYLTGQLNSLSLNVSPTVTITPNYVVNGSMPNLTGGLASTPKHAAGGMVSGRQLSWVGEEGPEMIIPLVSARRSRALELYEKAGEMLGVDKNADGGIVGVDEGSVPVSTPDSSGRENGSGENRITVEMSVNPNINISADSGTNAETIKKLIEQAIKNMMGDISDEMAKKLARQFANMGIT